MKILRTYVDENEGTKGTGRTFCTLCTPEFFDIPRIIWEFFVITGEVEKILLYEGIVCKL